MNKIEKLENLKLEMHRLKISILGVSETRWNEEGEIKSGNVFIVHSGSKKGQEGVAIIMENR